MIDNNYCAFSKDHKCILWMDYELTRHELAEANELCHGNWIVRLSSGTIKFDKKTDMVYLPKNVYSRFDVRRLDRRNLRLQCRAGFLGSYETLVCRRRGYVLSIQ